MAKLSNRIKKAGKVVNRLGLAGGLAALILFIMVGLGQERASLGAQLYTIPSSVKSDCSTDVTRAINDWIKSVPDNSVLHFKQNGCYRIDGTVVFNDRNNLVVDGRGATFRAGTDGTELPERAARTRSHFTLANGSGLRFTNMKIYGAHPNGGTGKDAYVLKLEAQHGFDVHADNVVIDNVEIYEVYGDFLYVGRTDNNLGRPVENVTLRDSKMARNGRQGIGIAAGKNILIDNIDIRGTRHATFDIEPTGTAWHIENVTIKNSTIGAGRLLLLANGGACANVKNLVFENNVMSRDFNVTIKAPDGCPRKRSQIKLAGNVSTAQYGTPRLAAIITESVDGLEVYNNQVPLEPNRNMHLLRAYGANNNFRIIGNKMLNATATALLSKQSTDICYEDNQVGNPLVAESQEVPCSSEDRKEAEETPKPKKSPPKETVNIPPAEREAEIEADLNAIGTGVTADDYARLLAGNDNDGGQTQSGASNPGDDTGWLDVNNYDWQTYQNSVAAPPAESRPFLERAAAAIKNIPAVLASVVDKPDEPLDDTEKRDSWFAFAGLVTAASGSFEATALLKKRSRTKRFRRHHNLDAAEPQPAEAPQPPAAAQPVVPKEDETASAPAPGDTVAPGGEVSKEERWR